MHIVFEESTNYGGHACTSRAEAWWTVGGERDKTGYMRSTTARRGPGEKGGEKNQGLQLTCKLDDPGWLSGTTTTRTSEYAVYLAPKAGL